MHTCDSCKQQNFKKMILFPFSMLIFRQKSSYFWINQVWDKKPRSHCYIITQMRLTLNWNSRHPDMKNDIAIITPPVIIRWTGFFKMLNLENVVTYKIDEWFWNSLIITYLESIGYIAWSKSGARAMLNIGSSSWIWSGLTTQVPIWPFIRVPW